MHKRELDRLLERAVAEALGVALPAPAAQPLAAKAHRPGTPQRRSRAFSVVPQLEHHRVVEHA